MPPQKKENQRIRLLSRAKHKACKCSGSGFCFLFLTSKWDSSLFWTGIRLCVCAAPPLCVRWVSTKKKTLTTNIQPTNINMGARTPHQHIMERGCCHDLLRCTCHTALYIQPAPPLTPHPINTRRVLMGWHLTRAQILTLYQTW